MAIHSRWIIAVLVHNWISHLEGVLMFKVATILLGAIEFIVLMAIIALAMLAAPVLQGLM